MATGGLIKGCISAWEAEVTIELPARAMGPRPAPHPAHCEAAAGRMGASSRLPRAAPAP